MKKVSITVNGVSREVPANEYPIRFLPKKDAGKATVNGKPAETRFTEGRGKSAINNHYIYFIEDGKLFYLRSSASEIAAARKEVITIKDVLEGEQPQPAAAPAEPESKKGPAVTPPKRQRRKATT